MASEGSVVGGTGAVRGSGPSVRWTAPGPWHVRGRVVATDRPVVMGIVNLTPDSFSDGGRFRDAEEAAEAAHAMVDAGAALVDVGGESTRPGAHAVPPDQELARILPFLELVRGRLGVPLSVDTRKAEVARAALQAGASVINDVSGLAFDAELAGVVADTGAGLVLMHMRGDPSDMAGRARYADVGREVADELRLAVDRARRAGVAERAVVVDPGIGFAKDARHSLALLSDLAALRDLGFPIMVGPSRKSFLGSVVGVPVSERLPGTLAACVAAYFQGARLFRVHDVGPVVQALAVAEALEGARTDDVGEAGL